MSGDIEDGGYFSRNYLRQPTLSSDSPRMRHRIAVYLKKYCEDRSEEFGEYIERELGIEVLTHSSYGSYIEWTDALRGLPIVDFLDLLTAVAKLEPRQQILEGSKWVTFDFIQFVSTVLREQSMAYRVDERGGIHPFIDVTFSSQVFEIVSGLSATGLEAARAHVQASEKALLAHSFDGTRAVRSIFDAVENIFKLLSPGSNQLNDANIKNNLRPLLGDIFAQDQHERTATGKLVESLLDWVSAGHFYRHEPGKPDPMAPSETFTIQYVSQGLSYVRWPAKAYNVKKI